MTSDETFRYDPTPMNHAFPGQPDDCFDMVNQYGLRLDDRQGRE